MEKTKKRELYSFDIEIEEEETKEVIKEVKKKNKETGKMETVEETVEKTVKTKTPVRVVLRKPTRTQVEDGDMFYSIWLNKFIKMGLLTRAMLAKKQVDVGGTLNEDDKMNYAKLYLQLFEKQQNVIRYSAKDPNNMSLDEKERLDKAVADLAVIRKELSDFEAAQASIFDHTADVKARNKTITWFLLHLAYYVKGEENEDQVPLFPGTDYEEKYLSYQEADEEQEDIFVKTIDRLSTVATIWYMSGVQEQDEFDSVIQQMNKEVDLPQTGLAESEDAEDDSEEQSEEEVKEKPKKEAKEEPKKEVKEEASKKEGKEPQPES